MAATSSSRVCDPSKLHWKRELTQIRKAARVLRDPGTTSSWKSPLSSNRSNHHLHFHHFGNGSGSNNVHVDNIGNGDRNGGLFLNGGDNDSIGRDRERKEKEKKVFLYNWRSNKSASEKSLGLELEGGGGGGNGHDDDYGNGNGNGDGNNVGYEGSSVPGSVASESVDGSLSDVRNGDSKSDTCVGDSRRRRRSYRNGRHYGTAFWCRDARVGSMASPTLVRKRKSKRGAGSSSVLLRQQLAKRKQSKEGDVDRSGLKSKWGRDGVSPGLSLLSQDDFASLMDQSYDTEGYCGSEDLRRGLADVESPLLARLKNKNRLLGSRRGDSSYTLSTPALSASSFNRFLLGHCKNPSTVGSWDGTTASFDDIDDPEEDPLNLPGRQGCGISCYWSKRTPKHKGDCGSCYSPSLSDTLRRKGGQLLCGGQKDRRRRDRSVTRLKKEKILSQMAQGQLPLLANSCDGEGDSSLGMGNSDDELSTNFGELNLEGVSRLDGRRWSSSCRSREGSDFVAVGRDGEEESSSENIRSLSQRYRPIFFDELIGQNIVVQSLMNSISKGRIAPIYLFQGPRGTGKTATAKIFAAALNCLVTEGTKPCGICRECTDCITGKSKKMIEVDGTDKKSIDKVRYLLKKLSIAPSSAFSQYKILLIEECHLLPSKAWLAFLKFLEEPLPRVVFIFVTTDNDNVPRPVLSRCQKYLFNKIKDSDIVRRLKHIASEENLDVDSDALELIALNADGSLRDAETMLDQLSLLGKRITTGLVNELVGVIPDEKLLDLLELAMSSNTAETVKTARDLMDSGVDPSVLVSQMASLIMDIIAGSYQLANAKGSSSSVEGRHLSETELEKLKHALKKLSEAEKELRLSSDRSTWFTATLLQLGSITSPEFTLSGSSKKQSSKTTEEDPSSASRDASGHKQISDALYALRRSPAFLTADGCRKSQFADESYLLAGGGNTDSKATHKSSVNSVNSNASRGDSVGISMNIEQAEVDNLEDIWLQCIARCHSKTLRQLLYSHGRLLTIAEGNGVLVAYIAFEEEDVKSRAEHFLNSIVDSIEMVLRRTVEIRLILLPGGVVSLNGTNAGNMKSGSAVEVAESKRNSNDSGSKLIGGLRSSVLLDERSSGLLAQTVANTNDATEGRQEIPMQRIESIIREQRLETAWLQAAEKSTPRSMSRMRPEKNQVLPQEGAYCQNHVEVADPMDLSSQHWDDELNLEIKALKVTDGKICTNDQIGKRIDQHPISPSLLHQSGYAANIIKEQQGYESGTGGSGCNMLFCWNTRHPRKGKVTQGAPVRTRRGGKFLCFGESRKSRLSRAHK